MANPNREGRPSPVLVQVFGLTELGAFSNAPMVELEHSARQALSGDLDGEPAATVLAPGESAVLEITAQRGTPWAGVVAQVFDAGAAERCVVRLDSRHRDRSLHLTAEGWDVLPMDGEGIVRCRTAAR